MYVSHIRIMGMVRKDGFSIKYPTKVGMALNKETKPNYNVVVHHENSFRFQESF